MLDLSGKVAVITGSSRGIGRSIAENMARAGARVVISSRKQEACDRVAESIRSGGGEAIAVAASLGHQDQLQALIDKTREAWDRVDILVCNAAVNPYYGALTGVSNEVFDKMMHCNVRDNLFLCKLVLPEMAERKDGVVLVISSVGGLRGNSVLGAYGITKAADMALVRNLAVEWGKHNIRINCIAPGLIKTDFAKALWEDEKRRKEREAATPLRRLGEPKDIGAIAVFLASEAAAFITGQTIVADGGVTIL